MVTDLSENHRQLLYEVLSDENRESMPETLLTYVVGEFKKRATLLFITLKSRPGMLDITQATFDTNRNLTFDFYGLFTLD